MLELNLLSFTAHHLLVYRDDPSPGVLLSAALFSFFVVEYLNLEEVHLYTYDFFAENPAAIPDNALIVRLERVPDRDDDSPYSPPDIEILPILFERACDAARNFPEAFAAIQSALTGARAEYRGYQLQRK